jgi:cell division protein FtsB
MLQSKLNEAKSKLAAAEQAQTGEETTEMMVRPFSSLSLSFSLLLFLFLFSFRSRFLFIPFATFSSCQTA